jgi:tetratricopeptide (TPR) repeat protein
MGFILNEDGIISGMLIRFALVTALIIGSSGGSASQNRGNITINNDLRLFTTMAAINAAGFDVEFGAQYHPVREAARKLAESIDPDLKQRLKNFYDLHKRGQTDEEQLTKYVSLAVIISNPPEFSVPMREEGMPPDAREVAEFTPLLREFYEKAQVGERWSALLPQYDKDITLIAPALRELIVKTDSYLRIPLGGSALRTMAIYVELAAPLNSVHFRSYQDNYYVVMGGSTTSRLDDVRHAYLHYHLDNLVAVNIGRIPNRAALLSLIARREGVDPAYANDSLVMTVESLIRAAELRMDRAPAERALQSIRGYYRSGLLLTPYFYEALAQYQQGDEGIREYFPEMVSKIDLKVEQSRFQNDFDKIPLPQKADISRPEVPQTVAVPVRDPMRELLRAGETALNANDNEKARSAFDKVLTDYDRTNGAAFYGLGLIASKEEDSEKAQDYFERAVLSDTTEPSMRVWAYIYLARIFDLECKRDRALEYYQQAIKVADNTRNAQALASEGLSAPYGGGCK